MTKTKKVKKEREKVMYKKIYVTHKPLICNWVFIQMAR